MAIDISVFPVPLSLFFTLVLFTPWMYSSEMLLSCGYTVHGFTWLFHRVLCCDSLICFYSAHPLAFSFQITRFWYLCEVIHSFSRLLRSTLLYSWHRDLTWRCNTGFLFIVQVLLLTDEQNFRLQLLEPTTWLDEDNPYWLSPMRFILGGLPFIHRSPSTWARNRKLIGATVEQVSASGTKYLANYYCRWRVVLFFDCSSVWRGIVSCLGHPILFQVIINNGSPG